MPSDVFISIKSDNTDDTRITLKNAFEIADSVLSRGTQSISDLINGLGFINLDFADVTTVMKNAGHAHMGIGSATGKDKAEQAARAAIASPLLESSISGAHGILMCITAPNDISLEDATVASNLVAEEASPDVNFIWGVAYDDELEDEIRITIIATGFDNVQGPESTPVAPPVAKDTTPASRTQPKPAPAPALVETVTPRKPARSAVDTELDQLMSDFLTVKQKKRTIR